MCSYGNFDLYESTFQLKLSKKSQRCTMTPEVGLLTFGFLAGASQGLKHIELDSVLTAGFTSYLPVPETMMTWWF